MGISLQDILREHGHPSIQFAYARMDREGSPSTREINSRWLLATAGALLTDFQNNGLVRKGKLTASEKEYVRSSAVEAARIFEESFSDLGNPNHADRGSAIGYFTGYVGSSSVSIKNVLKAI